MQTRRTLLTLALSLAAWTLSTTPSPAPTGKATSGEAGELAKGALGASGESYLEATPVTISVVNQGGARGKFTVVFGYLVKDTKTVNLLQEMDARLRDAFLIGLNKFASRQVDVRKPIDTVALKAEIQGQLDRMAGEGNTEVLLSSAYIQAMR